ncbi:MAG: hypothetical protein IKJ74_05370 [Clostridia bacterium]|nr:hypothetical protein [Clostridia bacterium]
MTNCNTMTRGNYLLRNAFWLLISMILFRCSVFIPLAGQTEADSEKILWGMAGVAVIAGVVLTLRKRRNTLSVATNVLFPYQIYALIAYWRYCPFQVKVFFIAAVTVFIWFFMTLAFRGFRPEEKNGAAIRKRLHHGLLGARTVFVLCLCAFIIPLGIRSFFGNELYQAQEAEPAPMEEWSVAGEMEELVKLKPDAWAKLDMQERLNVLDVLKNTELQHLGVYRKILLSSNKLEGNTLGYYSHNEKKIVIDVAHMQDSPVEKVVRTLLHECHHAYTHQQVELYQQLPDEYKKMLMFQSVQTIEKEYANYVNGNKDYEKYAAQLCESSADRYADEAAEQYYNAIFEYDNKEMKQ